MNETRATAQTLMACLGVESRFRLVQALIGGARCVTDLASEVGLSQSCTTRHLQALERRRVVSGRRDGKRVLYRIRDDDPGLLPLLRWALDRPTGGVAIRFRRDAPADPPSPAGRRTGAPRRAPGFTGASGPTGSVRIAPPLPTPDSSPTAPGFDGDADDPPAPPGPPPARRGGFSEIEDYLL